MFSGLKLNIVKICFNSKHIIKYNIKSVGTCKKDELMYNHGAHQPEQKNFSAPGLNAIKVKRSS